MLLNCP